MIQIYSEKLSCVRVRAYMYARKFYRIKCIICISVFRVPLLRQSALLAALKGAMNWAQRRDEQAQRRDELTHQACELIYGP